MVVTTTKFADLSRRVAENYGAADARITVVPHPLGGTEESTVIGWADAAVEHIIGLLTAP